MKVAPAADGDGVEPRIEAGELVDQFLNFGAAGRPTARQAPGLALADEFERLAVVRHFDTGDRVRTDVAEDVQRRWRLDRPRGVAEARCDGVAIHICGPAADR